MLKDKIGDKYESITGYTFLDEAINEILQSEIKQEKEQEELYNIEVNKILEGEIKGNGVVEVEKGGSVKVYIDGK